MKIEFDLLMKMVSLFKSADSSDIREFWIAFNDECIDTSVMFTVEPNYPFNFIYYRKEGKIWNLHPCGTNIVSINGINVRI